MKYLYITRCPNCGREINGFGDCACYNNPE